MAVIQGETPEQRKARMLAELDDPNAGQNRVFGAPDSAPKKAPAAEKLVGPTEEQMVAMRRVLHGDAAPPPNKVGTPEFPSPKEIADSERGYVEFRKGLQNNQDADVRDALEKGAITQDVANAQYRNNQKAFLDSTSPEAMEKATGRRVTADVVESLSHSRIRPTDERVKAETDRILADYKASPERAAWEKEYAEGRKAEVEKAAKMEPKQTPEPEAPKQQAAPDAPAPVQPMAEPYTGSPHETLDKRLDNLYLDSELNDIYGKPGEKAPATDSKPSAPERAGPTKESLAAMEAEKAAAVEKYKNSPEYAAAQRDGAQQDRENLEAREKRLKDLAGPDAGPRTKAALEGLDKQTTDAKIKENDAQARVDEKNRPGPTATVAEPKVETKVGTDPVQALASAEKDVVKEGVQKADAAERVAHAARLEQELVQADVKTPTPPPGSIREKVIQGDLEGATNQAAGNAAKKQEQEASQPAEPLAAAAEAPQTEPPAAVTETPPSAPETEVSAPEVPKAEAPKAPDAPAVPDGGIPRTPSAGATAGDVADAVGLSGKKGNVVTTAAVGLGVAAYSVMNGGSAAEAGKAGIDAVNPYAGTVDKALDKDASKLDVAAAAAHDTATLAGSTAGALAGAQAGAAAGAVFGPVGVAVGGVAGGVAGGIAGGAAVDAAVKHGEAAYNAAVDATSRGIEAVANAGSAVADGAGKAWDSAKSYMFGENKSDVSKPAEGGAPAAAVASTPATSPEARTTSSAKNDGGGIDAASPKTAFNDGAAGKPAAAESSSPAPEPKAPANEEKYGAKPATMAMG